MNVQAFLDNKKHTFAEVNACIFVEGDVQDVDGDVRKNETDCSERHPFLDATFGQWLTRSRGAKRSVSLTKPRWA